MVTNLGIARELLRAGGPIPDDCLPLHIGRSWLRSRNNGVHFADKVICSPVSKVAERDVKERNQQALSLAMPELNALLRMLRQGDWAVSYLDTTGAVVGSLCRTSAEFPELGLAFRSGVDLGERGAGTTGPACALAEERVVVVAGREHYLEEAADFCCTAAPVYDQTGRVIGAVNAATHWRRTQAGVPEVMRVVASRVGDRLVRDVPNALILEINLPIDESFAPPGVIALSRDGVLLGANQYARKMLRIRTVENQTFEDLFGASLGQTLDQLKRNGGHQVVMETAGGYTVCVTRDKPRMGRSAWSAFRRTAQTRTCPTVPPEIQERANKCLIAFSHGIPALVNGETGTGKEEFAKWLHQNGPSPQGPFVAVDCSSIPEALIESELFGYEAGSFTGASKKGMAGKIRLADRGTLFLDEIGDMPLAAQSRLLRVLQERKVQPLGSGKEIPVSFNLVSATHHNLAAKVKAGEFREDLYFRLHGISLALPPLRGRSDLRDIIVAVAREFTQAQDAAAAISGEALDVLAAYDWPGNLRQLRSVLLLAAVMSASGQISLEDIPQECCAHAPEDDKQEDATLGEIEKSMIREALAAHDGNVSATARALNISRATIYNKIWNGKKTTQDK